MRSRAATNASAFSVPFVSPDVRTKTHAPAERSACKWPERLRTLLSLLRMIHPLAVTAAIHSSSPQSIGK